ncbi:SHOCT domain-containing protein [Paenibacillus sp. URB8-2]|uniref:SHOCT domain-containing protein n=1 Tax=Paenibacillus sp. URB8-2 TaxID=2741301 RepID=UPI0015C219BC|nr:SHOCT domain-containing protein [Paenibacillus sp. URB8-2]BCG60435.1 hypothetical protein PUR_38600 [Paenibacillus sp. URB8-2]
MMYGSKMTMMCFIMVIGLLLLIIAIGITIYVVIRLLMRKYRVDDGPLMILKERYANGELSDEEFNHRRKLLDNKSQT